MKRIRDTKLAPRGGSCAGGTRGARRAGGAGDTGRASGAGRMGGADAVADEIAYGIVGREFIQRAAACALATMLAGSICAAPASALAAVDVNDDAVYEKNETVYGVLRQDGSLDGLYVINQFDVEEAGTVTDYGTYDSVENLTSTEAIKVEKGKQIFEVEQGEHYYQGNLGMADLPWDVQISYTLDGDQVSPSKLAGADGRVGVFVSIAPNESVDPVFYDNYLLQVSFTVPADACTDLDTAGGGSIAIAGEDRQISYTVMPGQGADLSFVADATSFEMSGITIAGVPYASGGTDLTDLTDGLTQMADGMDQLAEGAAGAAEGGTSLSEGLSSVVEGSTDLVSGSVTVADGLAGMAGTLAGLDTSWMDETTAGVLNGLKEQSAELSEGAASVAQGVESYTGAVGELSAGATDLSAGIGELSSGMDELAAKSAEIPQAIEESLGGAGDFEVVDFISDENDHTVAVQFTFTTDPIEIPSEDDPVVEEEQTSFEERLRSLFGLETAEE